MSLPNILLGLIKEPKSGYDIKQTFEQVLHYFWNSDLAQIYPALKKLEQDGLATIQMAEPDKGPAKKLYKRTPKGTRQLRAWLQQGPQLNTERLHYLTQVFFLDEIPPAERIKFFTSLHQYFKQQLSELIEVEKNWRSQDSRYPDKLPDKDQATQFTLRLGLAKIKAIIDWCESCLQTLRNKHQQAN